MVNKDKKIKMIDESAADLREETESQEAKPVQYIAVGAVHGNNKRVFQPGEVIDCLDGIDLKSRLEDGLIKEA
jgi:hypothetical protein